MQTDSNLIITMDPPAHGVYRQLTSRRFTPRARAPRNATSKVVKSLLSDPGSSSTFIEE